MSQKHKKYQCRKMILKHYSVTVILPPSLSNCWISNYPLQMYCLLSISVSFARVHVCLDVHAHGCTHTHQLLSQSFCSGFILFNTRNFKKNDVFPVY